MTEQQGIEIVTANGMVWMTIHQGGPATPIRMGFGADQAMGLANSLAEAAMKVTPTEEETDA